MRDNADTIDALIEDRRTNAAALNAVDQLKAYSGFGAGSCWTTCSA